jgi:hypothetical protein
MNEGSETMYEEPVPPAVDTAAVPAPNPAPVAAVAPARRRRGPLDWFLVVGAVVAIGGVAFGIGRATAPAVAAGPTTGFGGRGVLPGASLPPGATLPPGGFVGGPGDGGGGPTIDGKVTAVDGTTMTITTPTGETLEVTIDDSTTVREATAAEAAAIRVGDDVSVRLQGGFVAGGPQSSGPPKMTAKDITVDR